MKTNSLQTFVYLIALLAVSCNPGPKPIDYGSDTCHYCRMTIVDRQHGAELVTNKGKVYKFDSVECMVNSIQEVGAANIAHYLCNHYIEPGEFINAPESTYLISEALPSPMGANLTAFPDETVAGQAQEIHGGKLYDWASLLAHLKSMNFVYHE